MIDSASGSSLDMLSGDSSHGDRPLVLPCDNVSSFRSSALVTVFGHGYVKL